MMKILIYLVHMRGSWIPGLVLRLLGKKHQKNNMIENKGTDFYLTKSPLLLRIRHNYAEYEKKVEMRTNNVLSSLRRKLIKSTAKQSVVSDKLERINKKLEALSSMDSTGNVLRERQKLQEQRDTTVLELSEISSKTTALENKISGILEYKDFCKEKTRQKAMTKSYSYIEGCQETSKSKSFYSGTTDYNEELFQFFMETREATYQEVTI